MPKGKNLVKIHGAAVYFATVSRDIQEIATTFDVSERSVRRWAEEEQEWKEALNACGYKGEPTFRPKPTRKPNRDTEDLFKATYDAYIKARKEGKPLHKLSTIIAHNIGAELSPRRVYEWAKKYGWLDMSFGEKERIKIHGAAFYFAHVSRDIEKLAKFLKVSEDLLQQWTKSAEWSKSLEVYEYEGVRTFFRTVKRTSNLPTEIVFSEQEVVSQESQNPPKQEVASQESQNPPKQGKQKKGNTFR